MRQLTRGQEGNQTRFARLRESEGESNQRTLFQTVLATADQMSRRFLAVALAIATTALLLQATATNAQPQQSDPQLFGPRFAPRQQHFAINPPPTPNRINSQPLAGAAAVAQPSLPPTADPAGSQTALDPLISDSAQMGV